MTTALLILIPAVCLITFLVIYIIDDGNKRMRAIAARNERN